jgi:hypothetical protein
VTALLLFEAIDTVAVMADAILAWIAALALAATAGLYTVVLVAAWAWRAARRGYAAISRPHRGSCGSRDTSAPPNPADARTAPSWARTDKEAA